MPVSSLCYGVCANRCNWEKAKLSEGPERKSDRKSGRQKERKTDILKERINEKQKERKIAKHTDGK